ncbi:hypothetical protein CD351_01060 [Erythrobacter sp. KY5]|uniref:DUF3592 domain-containing protein n=1 Tax=Erythrobacter sp. KY5 TaxID=2011159 RepID=UPI000DBEF911|nr:DUF3592 domain-containing protein [Erythrobacter sp. KY5]AWW73010.1 hypothetical protein CD351_01060 [Erythrobacter sp. KY5]
MGSIGWWIGGIFTPIGLLFAAIGFSFLASDRELATAGVRTTGVVIENIKSRDSDGDLLYSPVVAFHDVSGVRHIYQSSTKTNWSDYSRGETVELIYNPDDPTDAVINSVMDRFFLPSMFAGLGSIFALIGAGFLSVNLKRKLEVAKLKRSNLRLEAEFVKCVRDTKIDINGRHPFRVHARGKHPRTGRLARFESAPIWLDLTDQLSGRTVPVLVDARTSKKHYVQLDEWVSGKEWA